MEKRVARDIMKPLSEVKMKSVDSRMTLHSWTEISDWGYSRVPIYMSLDHNKDNNSIYSDFNIKVLGFLHIFVGSESRTHYLYKDSLLIFPVYIHKYRIYY